MQNQGTGKAINFQSVATQKQVRTKLSEPRNRSKQSQQNQPPQVNQSLSNVTDNSQRTQYILQNIPSNDNISTLHENKNSINSMQIQKNFITSKRDSKESVVITTQSLGNMASHVSKQLQDRQAPFDQPRQSQTDHNANRKLAASQQNLQAQLIRKPASISIQHPQQFGNPGQARVNTNRAIPDDQNSNLMLE